MVDNYAKAAVFIRSIALIILITVAKQQHDQLSNKSKVQLIKWLLLALVVVMIFGNVLSILVNLFRQEDGNLLKNARHISTVWNALSVLAAGVLLRWIYNFKEK